MNDFINNKLYQKIHNYLPIVCVDIVIKVPDNGFLMVKRKENPAKDKWWLVGGRVFKNESLESAARRKVKDEIGLVVEKVEKIITGYELIFKEDPFGHENGTHTIVACFMSEIENTENLKLDNFHSQYKLFKHYDNNWHHYLKECLKRAGFSQE